MTPSIWHYLTLSCVLFSLGFVGTWINRKSVISILLCAELMLLAVNINFVAFAHFLDDLTGQIFSIFVMTIAAAESGIGLAIIVIYFRNRNTIDVNNINELKG
jgi:NADH-quinone oxidoreductase subunit K